MNDRYLTKLPPKSSQRAPGDVVGGLIFMMDKPVGVEPGMIGISIDSPGYRQYVEAQLQLLQAGNHPNKQLQSRYHNHIAKIPGFAELAVPEQIDVLLNDKIHIQRRYPLTRKDARKFFFSFGKLHEIRAGQRYYENVGTGGLLFHDYKASLDINKGDHFADHIQKMINGKNTVYMIKQDAKLLAGRAGPNLSRLNKTEVGKKAQIGLNPFVLLATLGLSGIAYAALMGSWRLFGAAHKPAVANGAAIVEDVATQLANIRGFNSQDMRTIEGTYSDGTHKVATIVTWSPGCRDMTGKLAGGERDKTSVIVHFDDKGNHLKVDANNDIIRMKIIKDKKNRDKVVYKKILHDGTEVDATQKDYQKAKAISSDRVAGLGESLISFLSMGDRDGIGEVGQNKVIREIKPPKGKYKYQFFGIDFGKAYEGKNPVIESLADDFSIVNPTARKKRFLNISILYDTPLREKMKGVYLLAALRNKLTEAEKEKIALDYEQKGDLVFAEKLRSYPESLFERYGENIGLELKSEEGAELLKEQQIKRWVKNGDLWWIKNEENNYRQKASQASDPKLKQQFLVYADRLGEVYTLAQTADKQVLKIFDKRLKLTPSQIDILENLEKLTAHKLHVTSPDGKVKLNHLRVERGDRVAWQLEEQGGVFKLICEGDEKRLDIETKLSLANSPLLKLTKETYKDKDTGEEKERFVIAGLTQENLSTLHTILKEENVAKMRKIKGFRTPEQQHDFHTRLQICQENDAKAKATPPPKTPPKSVTWQNGPSSDKQKPVVSSDMSPRKVEKHEQITAKIRKTGKKLPF